MHSSSSVSFFHIFLKRNALRPKAGRNWSRILEVFFFHKPLTSYWKDRSLTSSGLGPGGVSLIDFLTSRCEFEVLEDFGRSGYIRIQKDVMDLRHMATIGRGAWGRVNSAAKGPVTSSWWAKRGPAHWHCCWDTRCSNSNTPNPSSETASFKIQLTCLIAQRPGLGRKQIQQHARTIYIYTYIIIIYIYCASTVVIIEECSSPKSVISWHVIPSSRIMIALRIPKDRISAEKNIHRPSRFYPRLKHVKSLLKWWLSAPID